MAKPLFKATEAQASGASASDAKPSVAVEPAKSALPVTPEALADMGFDPAENLKDETPSFPLIKILPQAQMFTLADGTNVKEIEGVVIYTHRCNGYWDKKNPEEGNRPTCSSLNDVKPLANSPRVQSETCAACPLNQFGSEIMADGTKGRGKACKNMRRFYLQRAGHEFPELLSLSPTSLRAGKEYLSGLTDRKRHISTVMTKVSLEKKTSGSNVYSVAKLQSTGDIDDLDFLASIAKLRKQVIAVANNQAITGEEYDEGGSEAGEARNSGEPF